MLSGVSCCMAVLADAFLALHLLWIGFVIFGALGTRRRPFWTALHIAALCWGIVVEVGPWPCPLTLAEQHFEALAGVTPYTGGFLLHTLDAVIYPNLPYTVVAAAGVSVCAMNLVIYVWRVIRWLRTRDA